MKSPMTCRKMIINRLVRQLTPVVFFVLAMIISGLAPAETAAPGGLSFNHSSTGFFLDGAHAKESCESCHTQGQFRGTPRDCATCHRPGGRAPGKSATHVPTTASCDSCHGNASWTTSNFQHRTTQGVVQGTCNTCHNGGAATGKPARHLPTNSSCDSCHKSSSWLPAGYTHALVAPGACASCHNGTRATGKPAAHIPTSASCDSCHAAGVAFASISVGVSGMHANMKGPVAAGNCASCHNGSFLTQNAQSKPSTHIPTTAQCDTCHSSTSSWATAAKPDHAAIRPSVAGRCSDCHNSVSALGKPTNHIPTAKPCDSCHTNFSAFKPVQMNHSSTVGQCSSCHSGSHNFANAQSKPNVHIPTTAQCDSCHVSGFATWSPATMNHAGMTGKCSTCHSGVFLSQNAQTKPATHIATTTQCDSCHSSTASWATATFNHAAANPSVSGRCASCHNSVAALGKPSSHIPTGAQCDSCHANFTSFKPAKMNHNGMAGQCSTCHNGSYLFANALARPTNHIPSVAQCDTCHVSGFVNWSPTTMNHSGLAGQCSACHSGAYIAQNAQTKTPTHISTTAQCDSCHSSTTSWATGTFNHATATPAVAGRCSTCHNGTNALGKPTNHVPTTAQCDTCHANTTAFAPAAMNHGGTSGPAAAGNCSSCHSGTYVAVNALTKPSTHLATTVQCDTCHKSTTTWTGAAYAHAATATGSCSTCHNGATALGKPATHIPTSTQCDACHTNYTTFKPAKMNHAGLTGQCSTCHSGSYTTVNALNKPTTHIPTGAQCDTCHANGFISFSPAAMSHAGTNSPVAAGNCSTCHSGAYLAQNAQTKTPTHISTTAQCDTCHSSMTSWATGTFNHATATPAVAGRCSTCHNGTNALGKPTNHVPTTAQCDTCHANTTAFAPGLMNHGGTTGPVATGNCSTCHTGAYLALNAQIKPTTHVSTTAQCDTCHKSTATWTGAAYAHAATATGSCSTCHNGTTALGKPTTHIPTLAQCSNCHNNYNTFRPAMMSHAGTTGPAAVGNCTTCHNGSYIAVNALSKPATHIPTTSQCDSCHTRGYAAWSPSVMSHTGLTGQCSTCHSGAYLAQNAQTKTPTHISTTAQCDTCHNSTVSWATATFNHATATPAVSGRCSTCHNGTNALGKPSSHIPSTAQCDTCHKTYTAFAPATMSHTGLTGQCSTCHSGAYLAQNAQTKTPTHISTTAQCDTCHSSTVSWATATFNHASATPAVSGRCSTCHNGTNALGKPSSHIPSTAQCDTCHKTYTAFSPATMSHTGTTGPSAVGNCSTCHSGAYLGQNAQTKTTTHISTTAQCDTCHSSTVSWATATFNHATATPAVSGRCSTCHNGTNAMGKTSSHIPTTAQCDTCHKIYTAFAPALMSHSSTTGPVATGNCATCHNGAYVSANAQVKSATHIPTTQSCDACHMTTSWRPTSFSHVGVVTGSCVNCHNNVNASGKSTPHIPTTQSCDSCHRTGLSWLPLVTPYSHAGLPATGCSNCHSSAYPNIDVKPASHLPTTAACESCHHSFSNWLPATYNHAGVATGTCQTCHAGTYANIMAKPSNHIPTLTPAGMPGNECSKCHSSTASFGVERMNHGSMMTSCITCHDASSPYAGGMTKSTRTSNHHGVNAVGKDCSSSGCHKPLGSTGSTYIKWD